MTCGEHVGRTAKPPFRTTDRFRGTRSRSDQQPHAPSGGCGNTASGSSWSGSTNSGSALHQERSEEHTSELQSLMRISYAVFCLKKKKTTYAKTNHEHTNSHQT